MLRNKGEICQLCCRKHTINTMHTHNAWEHALNSISFPLTFLHIVSMLERGKSETQAHKSHNHFSTFFKKMAFHISMQVQVSKKQFHFSCFFVLFFFFLYYFSYFLYTFYLSRHTKNEDIKTVFM